jgi:hypothetical protein
MLADALQAVLPDQSSAIYAAFREAERFESDYNGAIDVNDSYLDFRSFAQQLTLKFGSAPAVAGAAQAIVSELTNTLVISQQANSGIPWPYPTQQWQWEAIGGISIYASLEQIEPRLPLYNSQNLQWAQDTSWDEFLRKYWAETANGAAEAMPTCRTTRDCRFLPDRPVHRLYLPLIGYK